MTVRVVYSLGEKEDHVASFLSFSLLKVLGFSCELHKSFSCYIFHLPSLPLLDCLTLDVFLDLNWEFPPSAETRSRGRLSPGRQGSGFRYRTGSGRFYILIEQQLLHSWGTLSLIFCLENMTGSLEVKLEEVWGLHRTTTQLQELLTLSLGHPNL